MEGNKTNRIILDAFDLEREKYLVLATCLGERLTARTMGHVNIGMDIFFQTDKKFLKVEHILKNP